MYDDLKIVLALLRQYSSLVKAKRIVQMETLILANSKQDKSPILIYSLLHWLAICGKNTVANLAALLPMTPTVYAPGHESLSRQSTKTKKIIQQRSGQPRESLRFRAL